MDANNNTEQEQCALCTLPMIDFVDKQVCRQNHYHLDCTYGPYTTPCCGKQIHLLCAMQSVAGGQYFVRCPLCGDPREPGWGGWVNDVWWEWALYGYNNNPDREFDGVYTQHITQHWSISTFEFVPRVRPEEQERGEEAEPVPELVISEAGQAPVPAPVPPPRQRPRSAPPSVSVPPRADQEEARRRREEQEQHARRRVPVTTRDFVLIPEMPTP